MCPSLIYFYIVHLSPSLSLDTPIQNSEYSELPWYKENIARDGPHDTEEDDSDDDCGVGAFPGPLSGGKVPVV